MRILANLVQYFRKRLTPQDARPFPRGVVILSGGESASVSYLLEPYVSQLPESATLIDVFAPPPATIAGSGCHTIIIARYLPKNWLLPLTQFRKSGGRIVYFMDDDLMDAKVTVGLPRSYARKIQHFAIDRRGDIERICNEFWVATPHLANKYVQWSPRLLSPRPGMADLASQRRASICYHGTASHMAELRWLVPVVQAVQKSEDSHFEVFGDLGVNRLYRGLPRIAIVHPMNWPNYVAYTQSVRRDIGLAPLLPEPFNAGRGPTKFFDFVRMGAVGIYTDVAPYRGFIRDGIDGLLLPNDPALWTATISALLANRPRMERMASAARHRAESMAWDLPAELKKA